MMNTIEERFAPSIDHLRGMLDDIETRVSSYSLADAIREGSSVSEKAVGWGSNENACALSAAVIACKARNIF